MQFRERSFNVRRVVKPADCLVRYRYPFVCGLIDPARFPIAKWRECVRDSVNVVEVGNWAADYSATDDEMPVEQIIQRVLSKRGIVAHPDEVLVTVGGQQALYLTLADYQRFHNHVRPHQALFDWQTPAEYLQSTKDCRSQSHIP